VRGHIKKRGDSWAVIIYLGKDPKTGKRKYKWYTVKGKEDDAERFLTDKLRQLDTNTYTDPGKLTVTEYLKRWVRDYCEISLSLNTLFRYKGIVENHLISNLGHFHIGKLNSLDVQAYYAEALKNGRKDGKGTELSPASVMYSHRVLHEALNHAVEWGVISRNVCDTVKPPKVIKREPKVLDRQTIDLLLAESTETPLHIPILITAQTGMRRGEICALQWKNVDLKAGIIYVKQAMEWDREQKIHRIKPTKNEENRRIDITKQLVDLLAKYKKDQKKQRVSTKGDCEVNDYVCTMEDGRHVTLDYMTKSFGRLAKKCHIDIAFHGLRHTHATILASMGIPVKAIAERLGNDPVVAMETYSHVTPSIQREIVQKLEQYFE